MFSERDRVLILTSHSSFPINIKADACFASPKVCVVVSFFDVIDYTKSLQLLLNKVNRISKYFLKVNRHFLLKIKKHSDQ